MNFNTFQNNKILNNAEKAGWKLYPLTDLLTDDSRNSLKIKKREYIEEGTTPIVDQGKALIGGYSNVEDGFYKEDSYLVFGDHTRILKYIDFPAFIGADGVKILKNINGDIAITKYLYYFLRTVSIPDTGYNRHFKFLKEVIIPVPKIEVQIKIVNLLDKIINVIDKRQQQIEALSALKQSIFLDMFGAVSTNKYNFKIEKLGNFTSLVTSGSTPRGGKKSYLSEGVPLIRSQNVLWNKFHLDDVAFISKETHNNMKRSQLKKQDVLLNITGASIGRSVVYEGEDYNANVNQHVCIIRLNKNINPYYLSYYITSDEFQQNVVNKNIGATRQAFNYTQIKNFNILVPNIVLQNEFENKVRKINEQSSLILKSLNQINTLHDSILHKAFNGELFIENVKV